MPRRLRRATSQAAVRSGPTPIEDPISREEDPSLRDAARGLCARRHEPGVEVDMRIAASMGGVLWLEGGALAALMLTFAPPTRAIGVLGWLVAAGIVALAVVIGVLRLRRPPPSDFGTLFAGSVIALLGIALLEWLAGGRVSPYHQLYDLPRPRSTRVDGRCSCSPWSAWWCGRR
jgi:hypothetical protein